MEQKGMKDRIAETFNGSTVFISGATGFIGKALVDKLLRVTNLKKLYLLIRTKKGKSPNERLQELFNNVLFDTLKKHKPDFFKKCYVISGDVCHEELGISKNDRELLMRECDFIFHSSATTRFDESIRNSVLMNARGTLYMLELAEACQRLKLFVHISTAYAFQSEEILLEKAYDPPANPHEVLNSLNWIKDDAMTHITKEVLGKIPNSYTFSKALAEALVNEKVGKIPLIICRPAIVCPSYSDPFPGWFNNLQGPMGLFVGCGKGVIRSMYMDSKSNANFVPVDCTVSGMMMFSWYYLTTRNSPYIFNLCVPETDIVLTWESLILAGKEVIEERIPFNSMLWYPGGSMTKSKLVNKINVFLFQIIPAIIIDFLMIVLGYKPFLYSIQMRILKSGSMFEYYTNHAWHFETKNIEIVRTHLNDKERQIYQVQADSIDVKDYLAKAILSARRYILKEPDDTLPAARRNFKIMYVLDKAAKLLFFAFLGYYVYKLLTVTAG